MAYNNNYYIMPSIYTAGKKRIEEKIELELFKSLLPKYLKLRLNNKTSRGDKTAILISNKNGHGKYDKKDHSIFFNTGLKYQSYIGKEVELFDSATSQELRDIIQDDEFSNIIVIGHANYHAWLASDKVLFWYDLGEMVRDHLKKGAFVNLGCGGIHSWNMIPLGYFVVSDHSHLLGYEAEYATAHSIIDPSNLKKLSKFPSLESILSS